MRTGYRRLVSESDIRKYLEAQVEPQDAVPLRQLTGLNGIGRFHARYGQLEPAGVEYVLKWPSHENQVHQLHLDLIVGRIGQLFDPPITPTPHIAIVEAGQLEGIS